MFWNLKKCDFNEKNCFPQANPPPAIVSAAIASTIFRKPKYQILPSTGLNQELNAGQHMAIADCLVDYSKIKKTKK